MCYVEHVYHRPCRHWGRDRFVGDPCCRSRFANGYHVPCTYADNMGSVNSNELCGDCRYRLASGGAWRPLAGVVAILQARVEMKVYDKLARP